MPVRVVHFLRPTIVAIIVFAVVAWTISFVALPEQSGADFVSGSSSARDLETLDLSGVTLPHARIAPDEVVRLQLAGLSDARADGVGILQCYAFASPANRAVTGPLDRFGKIVRQGPFQSLARPRAVLVGRPQLAEQTARVLVTIIDQHDQLHAFTFVLGRQVAGPFSNCWMTEAVLPSLPSAGSEPSPPSPTA